MVLLFLSLLLSLLRPSLGGRIKRCTPSICLSVRQSVCSSHTRFTGNRKIVEPSNLVETRHGHDQLGEQLWGQNENENVKSVFAHIFIKSGSIYLKPSPHWSPTHIIHNAEYIWWISEYIMFNYPGGPRVAAVIWPIVCLLISVKCDLITCGL